MPTNREIFPHKLKRLRFMPIRPVFRDRPIPRASPETADSCRDPAVHYQMVIMHPLSQNTKPRNRGAYPGAQAYFTQNVKEAYLLFWKNSADSVVSSMVESRHG